MLKYWWACSASTYGR